MSSRTVATHKNFSNVRRRFQRAQPIFERFLGIALEQAEKNKTMRASLNLALAISKQPEINLSSLNSSELSNIPRSYFHQAARMTMNKTATHMERVLEKGENAKPRTPRRWPLLTPPSKKTSWHRPSLITSLRQIRAGARWK